MIHEILDYIYENRFAIETAVWFTFTAIIKEMPEPGSKFNWRTIYEWIYDSAHQMLNISARNTIRSGDAIPDPSKKNN